MSYSKEQIFNLALTRMGSSRQITETEASKEAALCRLHYPLCLDTVLKAHPWNFAVKRVELSRLTSTPAFEFGFEFQLPADCLKVVRSSVEAEGIEDHYRIEDGKLLSNNETAKIEYIRRVEETGKFDPAFVDCLAARLAAEIATDLVDNASTAEKLMGMYEMKLRDGRSQDSQQGTPRHFVDDTGWLVSRNVVNYGFGYP
jgi:hypothetical protein